MENTERTMIPGKLIKYLFWLWGGAINVGLDFGLLTHGRWNNNKIILLCLIIAGAFFAINGTLGIIKLFKEEAVEAENQLI
ncbi:MAG: hypothetical protein KAS21_08505 [Candidatus Aminicenantes bacterium]|nr:hypothetical protein [Candidatus Aminicenantes bacterium]MCK5005116.1 hypothetical protein [Candidatus Aminicenantes bacterium]